MTLINNRTFHFHVVDHGGTLLNEMLSHFTL